MDTMTKEKLERLRALVEGKKCGLNHLAPSIEVISVPGGMYPVPCEQADCNGLNPAFAAPGRTYKRLPEIQRFEGLLTKTEACWLWQGALRRGYGSFRVGSQQDNTRRNVFAHRWSYQHFVGIIPAGLTIDHLCRVTSCVNPDHLEAVPMGVNVNRGNTITARLARRSACKYGHQFTVENTYSRGDGQGRGCRTCRRLRQRKDWKQRRTP